MDVSTIRDLVDPFPDVHAASTRVFLGPANSAGQAGQWAKALGRLADDTWAISYRYCVTPHLAPAHLRVDSNLARYSIDWNPRLRDFVVESFTHVLIESNHALWSGPDLDFDNRAVVEELKAAGVSVAMVAHGSDVKIPSVYRHLHPDTQYEQLDPDLVDTLETIARRNVEDFAAFDGPTFVTSPVLIPFVPGSRWLPLTLDVERWTCDRPVLERARPVVVHSPSSAQKNSVWIDPVLQELHDEGVLEYRRLQGIPHDEMPDVIRDADIVVEQLGAGGYGVAACEAMAAGRVVVGTVDPTIRRHIKAVTGHDVPIVRATRETIAEVVRELVADPERSRRLGAEGVEYVNAIHDGRYAADVLRTWIDPEGEPLSDVRPAETPPEPDCTVIVAVHNTATYLPEALASLERQTIGLDALQLVLVDDGSTDDSGRILDEFAARHGDNVVVIHQPPSGTPAVPFNRGLERATGRYVFFLGSDDVLDDDALELLVGHADGWESDVVFGRMEPIGERAVPILIYRAGRVRDMDLYASRLPYNLSNTKLFRRELVERLGLRYREDMRQRCDQPFTLTAMVNARRISMIGDGATYHARERHDRSNVTYTADAAEKYASTEIVMETIADCIPPGPQRDHVMKRQFDNTIRGDLRDSLALRDDVERAFVFDRIEDLAQRYLTDNLFRRMHVIHRAIIAAALRRDVETTLALLQADEDKGRGVDLHVVDGRAHFAYPGFDPADAESRPAYEITYEKPVKRIASLFGRAKAQLDGTSVVITGRSRVRGAPTYAGRLVRDSSVPSEATHAKRPPQRGREIDAHLDTEAGTYRLTIDAGSLSERVYRPSIALQVGDLWYDVPLRFEGEHPLRTGLLRKRTIGVARADDAGHLVLDVE
ncbi:glycosyltransferase [Aeromicrobium tamlense]|uniref:Glycosyltransferase n=1 Tax=Aeromicrobium tamlense TaxID=375541 RepID=A0A8I0FWL8_9ACTN|nr:glycosyltransferase family A protein [Aeromicrobium tamlense]MBD1270220.1 glycosyltransferase [Aeromicrobium tamlense]NYI39122.1 glycosyltransferase involved in cell wall biosynthesis [Aeromicrobium tamlense]